MKYVLTLLIIITSSLIHAQTQSWQWVKAGGSNTDNESNEQPAECKIGGCDAYGNIYAVGIINGENVVFDTFSCPGTYPDIVNSAWQYPDILLFSYDCAGNMRWARHIGDELNQSGSLYGAATDVYGNTYIARTFYYGYNGGNPLNVYLGDSIINSVPSNSLTQSYLCLIKYDSMGNLAWFKNLENDTVSHSYTQTFAYGLRIGSSGNLWMTCNLDSNYAISPNLHTTKAGRYNVQLDPNSGNILNGYYIAQEVIFGNAYDADTYHDLDENENYYETGTLIGDFGGGGDTLILANQRIAPDTSQTAVLAYIFSLDKNGNFRYIITNKNYAVEASLTSCKYDFQSDRLVTCWGLDSGDVYESDTFNFNANNTGGPSYGLLAINPGGSILWGKYVSESVSGLASFNDYIPTPRYSDGLGNMGISIYNNADTFFDNTANTNANDWSTIICHIDQNGNLLASHTAHIGVVGSFYGNNGVKYGSTDWRGNVYLGGTVTNFFATPADSVVNTDQTSGNFFIAKLGISDCSCPLPGVQFTQTVLGDTVFFYGGSANHSDSIRWRLGDGGVSSGDTFFHVYPSQDSTYTVTAIAYSGCGVDSISRQVTISTCLIPAVQFTQTVHGDTVFFYGSTTHATDSIRWTLGDGSVSSGDTFSHVYASHDSTYTVTAIAYSTCGSDTVSKQITVTSVGISVVEPNKTNLYPNPATNAVNLEVSGAATIGLVFANGSSAWEHPVQVSQAGTYVFDMAKYSSGLYYFIVQYTNGKTDVMKVVKE